MADAFAYTVTGITDLFGVVDLDTGVFTEISNMGLRLSGLGVGPGGGLYGGEYRGDTLYSINPATGALTAVGTSSITYFDTGSTTSGLYAVGTDGNLYSINPTTAAATLIGPTGLSESATIIGMSTGSATLYYEVDSSLYTLSTTTGAATLIGTAASGLLGPSVVEGGTIYADSFNPLAIYTVDGSTGASTFLALASNSLYDFDGLAPLLPPIVEPDRAHVQVDHTLTVNAANGVLANDIDPIPSDTLSVSAVDGLASNVGHALAGSYGTLTLNADGSFSYVTDQGGLPLLGVGIDTFSYTAAEEVGGTATSTLTVVVTSPWQTYVGGTAGTTIHTGFGSYVLDGGAGNDTLVAGPGIQVLIGGPNDTLTGSHILGVDTFAFAPNFGMNTINHFNPLFDSIQLPKSEFANFAAVQSDMQQVGANTVITYDTADVITLTGVHTSSLHASDFHFV